MSFSSKYVQKSQCFVERTSLLEPMAPAAVAAVLMEKVCFAQTQTVSMIPFAQCCLPASY
jgi:hypothetical protein